MSDAWDEVAQTSVDDIINAIPLILEQYPLDFISTANLEYSSYPGAFCAIETNTNLTNLLTNADLIQFDPQTVILQNNRLGFKFFNPSLLSNDNYREIHANLGEFYWDNGTQRFVDFFAYSFDSVFTMEFLWAFYNPTDPDSYTDATNPISTTMLPESHPDIQNAIALGQTVYQVPKNYWTQQTVYPTSHVNLYYDPVKFPNQVQNDLFKFFYYVAPLHLVLAEIVKLIPIDPTPFLLGGVVDLETDWLLP